MEFKLIDTNRFYIAVAGHPERFIHLFSIMYGLKEFIGMLDRATAKIYINDITSGNPEEIEDEKLFMDLMKFCAEKKLITIQAGLPPEEQPFAINKS
jgi:hypothetical protein